MNSVCIVFLRIGESILDYQSSELEFLGSLLCHFCGEEAADA